MGLSQMRCWAMVVIAMLLLLASCEGSQSTASSSQQQQQQQQQHNHMRKMLDASPSSPSARQVSGCPHMEELVQVGQNIAKNLGTGMPAYSVQITNTCVDCTVCNVHLACGNFANTELVDPAKFRRLRVNDCLVNNGGPIGPGEMVSFHYSNNFAYHMRVRSASCNCH